MGDEPALGLTLDRLAFRERPLRDEEDFPPVPQHQLMNPPHRPLVERPQCRPEVRHALNRFPHRIFTPAALEPCLRIHSCMRVRACLSFLFFLGIADMLAAFAAAASGGRRRPEEPDLVFSEHTREIREHAVHVEAYAQGHLGKV